MNLPYCKTPCKDCPFRKDSLKGWLGSNRIIEILNQDSFTCHKTNKTLQCAGHMITLGDYNVFVRTAEKMNIPIMLRGQELVFNNQLDLIKHHGN